MIIVSLCFSHCLTQTDDLLSLYILIYIYIAKYCLECKKKKKELALKKKFTCSKKVNWPTWDSNPGMQFDTAWKTLTNRLSGL